MELTILLGFYALGLISGVALTVSGTIYYAARMFKKSKDKVSSALATTKPKLTINERMKQVKDLTSKQLDLMQSVDSPQKNGLDGKHKNNINRQIKLIDEEKNQLLCSILEEGNDPELTTMDGSGVVTKMLLSEYMVHMGIKMQPKKSVEAPKTERMSRFTVVKGGKDDSGKTTH